MTGYRGQQTEVRDGCQVSDGETQINMTDDRVQRSEIGVGYQPQPLVAEWPV